MGSLKPSKGFSLRRSLKSRVPRLFPFTFPARKQFDGDPLSLRALICAAAAGVPAGSRSAANQEAIGSDRGRSRAGYAFDLIDNQKIAAHRRSLVSHLVLYRLHRQMRDD